MSYNELLENPNQIAILSTVGRFPGAKNIDRFWQNLRDGVESICFFPEEELEGETLFKNLLNQPDRVRANGILDDVELFDAEFFGYSPREAKLMDPQSRLFLEGAWEALELAGYDSQNFPGRIGVYAGATINTYFLSNLFSNRPLIESIGMEPIKAGNQSDLLTTRVAYKLNLQGSSVTVQTACSTSLVAVHLACQSLLSGECDMALAGGVSISVPQKVGYLYKLGGIGSPDGHCRVFDAKAGGTVAGSGMGVVVLKRLAEAIADGDCIQATIKGSAINNDGALKVGFSAPSVEGQAKAIAEAQAIANIEPESISYIEAHGTGTTIGDPIEVAALTQAFRARTAKKGFCAIGAVKSNIGHLNAAAGVTGLIKTVLALKHKQIPPSLHFQEPNPDIDFANSPFYVNSTLSDWNAPSPRRAGVSAFGIGGTNAHVILEEAPPVEASSPSRSWQLLVLSAKTDSALETATANLAAHLQQHPDLNLADVAHTLQVGRRPLDYRRILVCQDLNSGVQALKTLDPQRVLTNLSPRRGAEAGKDRPVAFLFSGQGSQYSGMGQELYNTEPGFRQQVDRCAQLLEPHLELDIRTILYPTAETLNPATLQATALAQPALFTIEYALAQLWISWGIHPQVAIGHSIGEYVAACIAGVFTLEEALSLVALRGRLMQELPSGAMLSVPLTEIDVQPLLGDDLSLAANNAPSSCVVSGPTAAIEALETRLAARGIEGRRLHTSHAFHSAMMEPILEPFTEQLRQINLKPPQIPIISNVTGSWLTAAEATNPHYWAKHLRQAVRFSEGIATILQDWSGVAFLEVGPGRTLSTFVKRQNAADLVAVTSLRHPKETHSDVAFLLNALGKLWLAGIQINWSGFYAGERRHRVPLPTYPFERKRYWIEPKKETDTLEEIGKKIMIADWFYIPSWKRSSLFVKPKQLSSGDEQNRTASWLVFLDNCGIGLQLAQRLEREGQPVITVSAGEQFSKISNAAYAINPRERDDYNALLQHLQIADRLPNQIVHLWSVTADAPHSLDIEFFNRCQDLGFYSLLFLAQAWGELDSEEPLDIAIATNNLQEVVGDEQLCPEKATVLGIGKVIPQEYSHITCRCIDIVIPEAKTDCLIDQLVTELIAPSDDLVVSYRGKYRWVQTFEPISLNAADDRANCFREGGVYLITGGLGGIGLVLAEHLAKTVQAKLILIGRSTLPEKATWEQWLATHEEQDSISQKLGKLQALEASGAEVLVLNADVGNVEEMQEAIARANKRFGPINGVIHAAGARVYNTIQQSDREACDQQFYPKVSGLYALETVLQNQELDFCLLVSSLAAIVGILGKAAYPASHNFLDTFARKYNRWISVNWDNWQIPKTAESGAKNKNAELMMTPGEGSEALERILSTNKVPQIIVSTADLSTRIDQWIRQREQPKPLELIELHSRPNLSNPYVAPRDSVEQILADSWQQILGIEKIGIHDNFFELGGDSVLGIQSISRVNQAGIQLTTKQVFSHQTIAELAAAANINTLSQTEQGLVTGAVPLTPIQQWFFDQNQPEPHYWNQAVLLEVLQVLDPELLKQAIQQLLIHHDALRLRFSSSETGWQQVHAGPDLDIPLASIDLPLDSHQEAVETKAIELQASLNLSSGPLMRAILFNLGQTQRLLIVIHHLVVDIVSWRILIEDLQTAYQQLQRGEAMKLPPKTTSFKQWAEQLQLYAQTPDLLKDSSYWQTLSSPVSHIPVDYPAGANTVGSARSVSVRLSTSETQTLLQDVPAVYRTQIDDVLLTALVQAFAGWTGLSSLLVDLEGSGREVQFEGVDLSRTVGWFTTIYPVLLSLETADNPGEALKAVKEQRHCIPKEGIGYSVERYGRREQAIAGSPQSPDSADIIFLYLGQLDQSLPESKLFRLTRESSGPERSPKGIRPHLLQVTGFVTESQLQLDWTYSENLYRRETIEKLARSFLSALEALIAHCQVPEAEAVSLTPSDFSAAGISQKDLSKLLGVVGQSNRRTNNERNSD